MSDEQREWVAIYADEHDDQPVAIVDGRYVHAFRRGAGLTGGALRDLPGFTPPGAPEPAQRKPAAKAETNEKKKR